MEADRYVFLDETGANVAMTRRYGRSRRGRRVYGAVPHRRGKNLTVVGAISAEGVVCHRALDGGMDGAAFLAFVTEVLIPRLRPGQVVVMDNLSSHKTRAVRAAFAAARVTVVYLPRYSPELNPIELCWSKVKARLRAVAARTREALRGAVAEALGSVGRVEVRGWIRHCGYRLTPT
jgi:transposase